MAAAFYNYRRFGSILETGYGAEAGRFTSSFLDGFLGLLVSPGRGFVFYCSLFLLSALGASELRRRSPAMVVATFGSFLLLLLGHSTWHMWEGGWCFGPRFLFPALPLLMVPTALGLARLVRTRLGRALLAPLVLWSLLLSHLSATVNYLDYHFFLYFTFDEIQEMVRWSFEWAPMAAWWTFPEKHFLIIPRFLVGWGGPLLQVLAGALVAFAAYAFFRLARMWREGA